jgi:hypothetical protein
MDNPGLDAAGQTARASSELQQALSALALPAIKQAMGAQFEDLAGPGQIPVSVSRAFGQAREATLKDFDTANVRGRATIQQASLQSGLHYDPASVSAASVQLGQSLDESRANAIRALNFKEANAGLNQTNYLLSQLTGESGQLLSGAMNFGGNALQSSNLLSQQYQQGAQTGGTIGSVLGAVIGTAAGGNTALGAGLGGLVGSYFGGR